MTISGDVAKKRRSSRELFFCTHLRTFNAPWMGRPRSFWLPSEHIWFPAYFRTKYAPATRVLQLKLNLTPAPLKRPLASAVFLFFFFPFPQPAGPASLQRPHIRSREGQVTGRAGHVRPVTCQGRTARGSASGDSGAQRVRACGFGAHQAAQPG